MGLRLKINGTDYTAHWRPYESRWTSRAYKGESFQSEFVLDDDGTIPHADLASRKIVTVWEDGSGSDVCLYRGRIANKVLGRPRVMHGNDMVWWVTTEDSNIDLRGLRVHESTRSEETDDVRVEAYRLGYLNGASSTNPRARDSTTMGDAIVSANLVTLDANTYDATDPCGVFQDILDVTGKTFFVYVEDDGDMMLYYADHTDTSYSSDIEVVDTDLSADGVDIYAADLTPNAGDHNGQDVISGAGLDTPFGYFELSDLAGAEDFHDKWEEHLTDDRVRNQSDAESLIIKYQGSKSNEDFAYHSTFLMTADNVHRLKAGMMVPLTRQAADKSASSEQRAVQVSVAPKYPDEDGNAVYEVTTEYGVPRGTPLRRHFHRPVPKPPGPTTPSVPAEPDCYDGDSGAHTETIPAHLSQPEFTTAAWLNETSAGYNHPEQYYWRMRESGDYSRFPDATSASGNAGDYSLGTASEGDQIQVSVTARYQGAFPASKKFRIGVDWLSDDYDGNARTVISTSYSADQTPSSSITSHSFTATAPASTVAYRINGGASAVGGYEPWNMHSLCVTDLGSGTTGTPGDGHPDSFPDGDNTGTYAPWPHSHTFLRDRAPTTTDDGDAGYHETDLWINTETGEAWTLTDDSDGAAVWLAVADDEGVSGGSLSWFNVLSYGALGDGTTDDLAAINLAIADLIAAGRGVLYFPAGNYLVSAALDAITVPCTIRGDGASGVDAETAYVSRITCSDGGVVLFDIQTHAYAFESLALVCSDSTPTAGAGIAVTASGDHGAFRDISVKGFYINVDVQEGAEWRMEGSYLMGPALYALKIRHVDLPDGGDVAISDTQFIADDRDSTAAIWQESGGGLKITNCKINGRPDGAGQFNFTDGIHVAIATGINTSIVALSNVSIENVTGDAIDISTVGTATFSQIVIDGVQVGLYGNNTGRAVKVTAAAAGGHAVAGGISGVSIDGLMAITDGTARAAVELTNTDVTTLGELTLLGFNARYTGSGDTNTSDGGSGSLELDDLTDVTITTPTEDDQLQYISGEWVNNARRWEPVITDTGSGPELVFTSGDIVMTWADYS